MNPHPEPHPEPHPYFFNADPQHCFEKASGKVYKKTFW
jgi:hypothetical protein